MLGKGMKLAALTAVVAPFYTGGAIAQPASYLGNVNLDTTGNVSACPTGMTCTTIASGTGFAQVMFTDSTGTYIRNVVANPVSQGSTQLSFLDDSFVKITINQNGSTTAGEQGIIGLQQITENANGTSFASATNLRSGWGVSAGQPGIDINQNLQQLGGAGVGDDFSSQFLFSNAVVVGADGSTQQTGFRMDVNQVVGLQQQTAGGTTGSATDVQVFTMRQRDGTMLPTAGAASLLDPNGGQNQQLSYVSGDNMKVTWLGQSIDMGTAGAPMQALFGYESYTNTPDTGLPTTISYFSLSPQTLAPSGGTPTATNPFTWYADFGAAPTMTSASGTP